jgi:hypothetical protein
MSSLKSIWPSIRQIAISQGIPDKPRALLREYLQVKALDFLYSQKGSEQLSFVGGTSLRLLHDIPRFSEDLDFDNLGLSDRAVIKLIRFVASRFVAENIPLDLFEKIAESKTYFELRFPEILLELGISTNPREKLMIKVDYGKQWTGQTTTTMLMRRLGIVQNVVSNTVDQILVEKLAAYAGRKTVQPRDMYDAVWLFGRGAILDSEFIKANHLTDLMERVSMRLAREKVTTEMQRKLAPFLFVPSDEQKLHLFAQVVDQLT